MRAVVPGAVVGVAVETGFVTDGLGAVDDEGAGLETDGLGTGEVEGDGFDVDGEGFEPDGLGLPLGCGLDEGGGLPLGCGLVDGAGQIGVVLSWLQIHLPLRHALAGERPWLLSHVESPLPIQ